MGPFYVEGYLECPAAVGSRRALGCGDGKAAVRRGACWETELSVESVQVALNVRIAESINDSYCLAGATSIGGRTG